MRAIGMVAVSVLLLAAPTIAAPTCRDRTGATIKCGTDGAMPVGWSLPPELVDKRIPGIADPEPRILAETVAVIALLFTLIALLPEFDGRRGSDWDTGEHDDEDRD